MKNIGLLFCLLQGVQFANGQMFYMPFDDNTGKQTSEELISSTEFNIVNHFSNPERIEGVNGNALRFDGYTTNVESDFQLDNVSRELSVELWYATESFYATTDENRQPVENSAIVSQRQSNEGFAIEVGPFGELILIFNADGTTYTLESSRTIPKYAWNHIVATISLDTRIASLYLNGVIRASLQLPEHDNLTLSSSTFYIGRNSFFDTAFGLSVVHCNGAIDELKIYDKGLSEAEIVQAYENFAPMLPGEPVIFEDFEGDNYGNWEVSGTAFGPGPAQGTLEGQNEVTGFLGNGLVNSFNEGDASMGTLLSPVFTIERDLIRMLVGGGNHPGGAEVRLLVDGQISRTFTGQNAEMLSSRTWNVTELIGRTAQIEIIDDETGGWGHINVDHITFEDTQELVDAALSVDPRLRHGSDRLRPVYHPMPATSWANESYGLIYYNNLYHMFFQKNPNAPVLHFMHWGHLSSPDLVDWKEERIPFGPDKAPGFDDFGTWSGTSIFDQNGNPVLVYTGVNTSRAAIALATPDDESLITWTKFENNPVVSSAPPGLADFRDPFLWKDEETYYMIVGSGFRNNGGGTLPTYKSTDLVNWERIRDLHQSTNTDVSGRFWEMPAFVKLNEDNDYALVVGPLFSGFAKCLYWIGKWENENFTLYHQDPKFFDPTQSNLLAPAFGYDKDGRITYIGIIPETRSESEQLKAGWRQTFSIPRVMRLLNDTTLGHYAHPNLCRYRSNEVLIENRVIGSDDEDNLPEFSGDQTEYLFNISSQIESEFKIVFMQNPATGFGFNFEISMSDDLVIFNGKEFAYDFDSTRNIEVHAFVDHSVLEIFLDNTHVFSRRLYPVEGADNINIVLEDGSEITLVEAYKWDRLAFGSDGSDSVCEPINLPDNSRKPVKSEITSIKGALNFRIYPNPSNNEIMIKGEQPFERALFYDLSGKLALEREVPLDNRIDTKRLKAGVYILRLNSGNIIVSRKIVIEKK